MTEVNVDPFFLRMKEYEAVAQATLMRRTPVIVRVDGKNFSKLTKGMQKPFDQRFAQCMDAVALTLASEAQNCRLAFHYSDEVSLLLTDFRSLTTEAWFGNQVQKICSVTAGLATASFAAEFIRLFPELATRDSFPIFDARCFNIPREEVMNYFIWRQRDAERNSVAKVAQAFFSHRQLQGADRTQMRDMLTLQKGVNWNDYASAFKMGSVVTREVVSVGTTQGGAVHPRWVVSDAPTFTQERDFIEKFLRDEEVRA